MLKRLLSKLLRQFSLYSHAVLSKNYWFHLPTSHDCILHDMHYDCLQDYVDNVMITSKEACDHVNDLIGVFGRCRKYKLRMNTSKCAFDLSLENSSC